MPGHSWDYWSSGRHAAGSVRAKTILVQGAGGAVGLCAVQLARFAGALVIGTVRSAAEEGTARKAGAHQVLFNGDDLLEKVRQIAPDGPDHIVEVAFGANIERDIEMVKLGGTLATYATNDSAPKIPFWPMVFKNIQINFLGSDDFPIAAKIAAAKELNRALASAFLAENKAPPPSIGGQIGIAIDLKKTSG